MARRTMYTHDQEILHSALHWLQANKKLWLAVLVKTVGSSPRPVGSQLLISASGQVGSLSGGCVEEDLLQRIRSEGFCADAVQLVEYGLNPEQNERLGLPCGGRVTIAVQQLQPCDEVWIQTALTTVASGQCGRRVMDMRSGESVFSLCDAYQPLSLDEHQLVQYFGPRQRMLLVGAGQLSQVVAELALAMDYEVLVTDPRQNMIEQWAGPAVRLLTAMPDDVIREHGDDTRSLIITLTHDPRIDDMALLQALESKAWYVGALGSKRTTEKRLARLRELGLSEAELARLSAPVGLDIGSKTPLEIAVSIMAEIIQCRRSSSA